MCKNADQLNKFKRFLTALRLTRQPGTDGQQLAQLPKIYSFSLAEVRIFSLARTEGEMILPNLWSD
jgi:hypothetical protein